MAVQYPTSPFAGEGSSGTPGIDVYARLVGNEIYYQNVNHKANNSLYPLLVGIGQRSAAAVTNHPSHNHQGGIKGEFVNKNAAGLHMASPVAITNNLNGSFTTGVWYNSHPSSVGDKGHLLLLCPPGCDTAELIFYAYTNWPTGSNDCDLVQIQWAFQSYGLSSDNNITTTRPGFTIPAPAFYGSECSNGKMFKITVPISGKVSDSGPTHKPSYVHGTLVYQVLNPGAATTAGKVFIYGPNIICSRQSRS